MRTELRPTSRERESCPLCREALGEESGPRVRCDRCRAAYHWACLDELGRGGCMTMGCPGALIPENLPPPRSPSLHEAGSSRARERFAERGLVGAEGEAASVEAGREGAPPPAPEPEPGPEPPGGEPAPPRPPRAGPLRIAVRARRGPLGTPLGSGPSAPSGEEDYEAELKAWNPRRSSGEDPSEPAGQLERVRVGLAFGLLVLGLLALGRGAPLGLGLWFAALCVFPRAREG